MALEIERKFLVLFEVWRGQCARQERLVDGLLATSKGRKVRVRIYGDRATIAIKTRKTGRARHEYEYEIPLHDARQLLANECGGDVVAKKRHYVPFGGFTWEVDVYEGALAGLVIAEVELRHDSIEPPRPAWIGREVTDDPDYRQSKLRARARGAALPTGRGRRRYLSREPAMPHGSKGAVGPAA
jgi:CYTH domain-containing protein